MQVAGWSMNGKISTVIRELGSNHLSVTIILEGPSVFLMPIFSAGKVMIPTHLGPQLVFLEG